MEEQQHGINQPTTNSPIWATALLGAVVTINILEHILLRWKSYDLLGKSLCVVLLANLAVLLIQVFQGKKRKLQPEGLLLASYVCLMLTTWCSTITEAHCRTA